jgi:uncharacterized membrane protein
MKKERLEVLSDGVIVIIMTIMVFEIKLPELPAYSFSVFMPVLQHIAVYAMSFLVLAVMWINHHHIFIGIEKVSTKVVWTNFLLLFFMSLIPLPTKALGENFNLISSHIFYGIVLASNSVAFTLLQAQVIKTASHLSLRDRQVVNRKNWFAVALYGLSVPLSFLSVYASLAIFILIPSMYFLPSKRLREK